MSSQIRSDSNIITSSSTPKSPAVTTNNMLQQLQQLQRITQQMPIFMAPSKTTSLSANSKTMTGSSAPKSTSVTTNNVFQQLNQLQRISQQIAPSKTTSLSTTSNTIPNTSTAVTMNNVQQPQQIIPITMTTKQSSSTTSLSGNSNIFNTSSAAKSVADTTNKVQPPQQPRKQQWPRISYILYLHLEEMRRSKATKLSKAKAKWQLTQELISKTMRTVHKLSPDEMEIISQQTIYKKNLEREIATEKHKIYMENYQKQQKANFPKKKQQTQTSPQQYQHPQSHVSVVATPMEGIPSPGYFSRRT